MRKNPQWPVLISQPQSFNSQRYIFEGFHLDPALTAGNTIINYGYIFYQQSPHHGSLYDRAVYRGSTYLITNPSGWWVFCDVLLGPACMDELGDQAKQGLTKRGCLKQLSNLHRVKTVMSMAIHKVVATSTLCLRSQIHSIVPMSCWSRPKIQRGTIYATGLQLQTCH